MQLMLEYEIKDLTLRGKAVRQFLESGGQPPAGVTLLARWHKVSMNGGFVLVEATDARALAEFAHEWADVLHMDLWPVVGDADLAGVFRGEK